MNKSWLRWVLLALAALPALWPLYCVAKFGVDIPFYDQWAKEMAGLFIKIHHGNLSPGDFIALQNEHRLLVPKLLLIPLGFVTHWNTIVEMIFVWLTACVMSVAALWLCHQTMSPTRSMRELAPRAILIWFLCNLFIFTPASWENWLWGICVQFVMPPTFLLASLVVLGTRLEIHVKIGIAMLLCTLATFSMGNGMLTWPLVGAVLAWSASWKQLSSKRWILLAWLVAFMLNFALYLIHFKVPPPPPEARTDVSFSDRIAYFVGFLGAPLAYGSAMDPLSMAELVGTAMVILLLAAFGYFLWRWLLSGPDGMEICRRMLPWFALSGFAVLSAAIASVFRANLFIGQALSSRYSPFATCMTLGLVGLIPLISQDIRARFRSAFWSHAPVVLGSALMIAYTQGIPSAIGNMKMARFIREQWKGGILVSKVVPDNQVLLRVAKDSMPMLLRDISEINAMGWLRPPVIENKNAHTFEADPQTLPANAVAGAIERMGQDPPGGRTIKVLGWAAFPREGVPAHAVFLTYEDENGQPIVLGMADNGLDRPDVAQQFGNSDLVHSGFIAVFSADRLPNYMKSNKIAAWALNCETGKAVKLQVEPVLNH